MNYDLIARLREHAENMYVDFLNDAADALEAQARRIAELSEAVGLLTTLKPDMEIDANNPINMAAQIVAHVDARIAELEAENARLKKKKQEITDRLQEQYARGYRAALEKK